jgi:hypothetical protein
MTSLYVKIQVTFLKSQRTKLWLFTSYSYDDDKKLSVGGLTTFLLGVIKKIERIK